MTRSERDNPDQSSRPAETVRRLHDANRERIEESKALGTAGQKTGPLAEDPMMNLPDRPRRKRCKYCRYRFGYRMHTNRCPECGRYRDDYPHPNHGLQAMVFAMAVVGVACVVVAGVLVVRGM